MSTQFRHVGIVVTDLEKSLDLWVNVLGFQVIKKMNESGIFIDTILGGKNISVTTVKLRSKTNEMIELLYFNNPSNSKSLCDITPFTPCITHVALTVDNLDDLALQLSRRDFTFISKPQISQCGSVRVAFARSSNGIILELVELISNNG